ncbi:MAG: tRNA (cytidine(34)-2'-O)-methyltransferase [Chlamydiae bacterium]|nr:tRNA (cytidine(34)-2'-O)-methyltransferase [Chlamydiota bacterium]
MKIVLFEPQIPQNTGNIVRTCSITGAGLVLVRPLGFRISDKTLKRAGLDYWDEVDIEYIDDLEKYLEQSSSPFYFFSSKASRPYTDISFGDQDILIFGSETAGLPQAIHDKWANQFYTIPMKSDKRSLNLSNTAAIVSYEALRQQAFEPLLN